MNQPDRYRHRRPAEVDAIQWTGETNCPAVFAFLGFEHPDDETDHGVIHFDTPTGTATAQHGDWILRNERGEYGLCTADLFAAAYEPAAQSPADRAAEENTALWDELHRRDTETDQPHATDRAALRDRIAEALISWTYRGKDPEHGGILETVRANAYSRADAVLAVLPAPVDRAAVLLWAAEQIDAETRQAKADGVLEPDKYRPCRDASAQLRRLAGEQPAQDEARRCPRCSEDLTAYEDDDFVYLKGDDRPYCSGECVVAAHRAELKRPPLDPVHILGIESDQPPSA
jgi:hypothetical protein